MKFVSIIFLVAGILPALTASLSCPGLNDTIARLNHAKIYPANCTSKEVPMGTTCYWVCDKGYGFKDKSHTETECNLRRHIDGPGWTNYQFYDNTCKTTTKCPPLDSYNNKTWDYLCSNTEASAGTICKASYCYPSVGTKVKECQSNGTWMPLGGQLCKPDSLPASILCQKDFTVRTDPGKATADITTKIAPPKTDIAGSEIIVSFSKANDLRALPKGFHTVTYTLQTHKRQAAKYCRVHINVVDKEPPMMLRCPKQLLYTVAAGLKAKITLNISAEVVFVDRVDGQMVIHFPRDKGNAHVNQFKSPGNYTLAFMGRDFSGNNAFCVVPVIVKAKPCKFKFPAPNALPVVNKAAENFFLSKCLNGTSSICDAHYTVPYIFDMFRCSPNFHASLFGVTCDGSSTDKPLPGCVNDSMLFDTVNSSCLNGTVPNWQERKCYPCARSMYFNYTTNSCQLCPANTTNYEFGSSTCYPCPNHQMTKLTKAPRFCEDICSPGSWIDSANQTCTKCARGYYAHPGARNCTKCPQGLTTLEEESTKIDDCVYGDAFAGDAGTKHINHKDGAVSDVTSYYLKIKPGPFASGRMHELMAFQFQSSYLNQSTNCSENFVRISAVINFVQFYLTDRICGAKVNEAVVVGTTASGLILEMAFTNASTSSLSVSFGIANCAIGEYFNFSTTQCTKCPLNTHQNMLGATSCEPCQNGKVTRMLGAAGCLDMCPKGTLKNGTSCSACPIGYYQDEVMEHTSCKKCPNNTITQRTQSTAISDCIEPCKAGEYKSNDGCKPCQIGMYQDITHHAYGLCKFCPKGTTTIEFASKSNASCVVECSFEGEYYDVQNTKCKKCPIGSYKLASDRQLIQCKQCPTNHTTNRLGAASITECIDTYDNCSPNPCKFPGWCEDIGTDFKCHCPFLYAGKYCEKRIHACETQPCVNNGTCHNGVLGHESYFCQCLPGFTGINCENVYHPCVQRGYMCGPGNCSEVGNDIVCHCPPWVTGKFCSGSLVKPCQRFPCRKGVCTNGPYPKSDPSYICSCHPDYTGKNCDSKIDDCIKNDCNKTGTMACLDGTNSYKCHCNLGFKGRRCNDTYGCLPGEKYDYYKKTCSKCEIGKFQPHRGDQHCRQCPDAKTTLEEGTTSISQCVERANVEKFMATLRITSEAWSDDFLDKASNRYLSFVKKIKEACKKTYETEPKYLTVIIESISKGSIVCKFAVFFEFGVQKPEELLKSDVNNGSFGDFAVDKISFDIVKSKDDKKEKKNYTLMAVLLVVGVLLVIGVITLYLMYTRHKMRVRVRFDKMLTNETATIEYPLEDK